MSIESAGARPERDGRRGPGPTPRQQPPLRPWSAFNFRDYRILWLSSAAGLVTMQMRLLVTGVWLYDVTGSGLQLGLLGAVQLAVQLPAILYGGALADQMDRKKLIAITQSFSFIFIALMTALVMFDRLVPWHVYAVTAILGVTSILGGPARSAITANVVPRSHLLHAVTCNTATFQIGAIAAPLAFTVIIETSGNHRSVCRVRRLRLARLCAAASHQGQDGPPADGGLDAPTDLGRRRLCEVAPHSAGPLHHGHRRYDSELLPPDIPADRGQDVQSRSGRGRDNVRRELRRGCARNLCRAIYEQVQGKGHDSHLRHSGLRHTSHSLRTQPVSLDRLHPSGRTRCHGCHRYDDTPDYRSAYDRRPHARTRGQRALGQRYERKQSWGRSKWATCPTR